MLRRKGEAKVRGAPFDIAIIGGGINGCGIARDAAGRGLSVYLCEKSDLAGATSSASTKLIHGGLRYLEYYEFRLVREALMEREVLLRAAPHIISAPAVRPPAPQGTSAGLADQARPLSLRPSRRPKAAAAGAPHRSHDATRPAQPLKPEFRDGFEYSDCWVDDARLVVLNAMDAAARGAVDRDAHRDGEGGAPRRRLAA